jgi:hypothetical protein
MIETATFSMFHRARRLPALPVDVEPVEERDEGEQGSLSEELLPGRLVQQIRARRQAARERMLANDGWTEPDGLVPELEPATPELEPYAPEPHLAPEHPATQVTPESGPAAFVEPAPDIYELGAEDLGLAPRGFEAAPELAEPFIEPIHAPHDFDAADEPPAAFPEPLAPSAEILEPAPEVSEPEPLHPHQPPVSHPGRVAEVAAEPPTSEALWVEQAEPFSDDAEYSVEAEAEHPVEAVEAPPVAELELPLPGDELAPAGPTFSEPELAPELVYLDPAPANPLPEAVPELDLDEEIPPPADEEPLPEWAPPEILRHDYHSDQLTLEYQLLGLANPLVCTVIATIGDAAPTRLSIGRTGIYRPEGFRPAPWSGFAYDQAQDGRAGLVVGTRILTARGEIPVEQLIPGDSALALRGPALLPILWIGRSLADEAPVQIAAGAFGPDRPRKTLCVGADHAIFMQTFPVAARELVNGSSIRRLEQDVTELFHIDVGPAEVLLAEGIPLASGRR